MVTPAFAPYVQTYASYTPYITPAEFLAAPTGVDVSQLVPSGSTVTQEAALLDLIGRASGQADVICRKVLAATLDIVSGEYRVARGGVLQVPVPYSPIVSVNAVSVGYAAGSLTALANLSGLWIGRNTVRIPVAGAPGASAAFSQHPPAFSRPGWMFAQVSYVNGWAHATIAPTAPGDTSITPANVLGFVPGLPVTIKDGAASEAAVVAPSYVPGSATVPLAAPLRYAHVAGTTVSALPPVVKDAVLDLCKWLVKQRGSKGIAMGSIKGQPVTTANAKTQPVDPGGLGDYRSAERSLLPLRRSR